VRAPVVVFGIGNRSRGDDALGPILVDRLRDWLEVQGLGAQFELLEEYQLNVENALDLEGRRLALFVDACRDASAPVAFGPVGALSGLAGHSTHALAPGEVLGVYARLEGEAAPPAFVLAVRGASFELGAAVSEGAQEALEDAWVMLRLLAHCPGHAEWQTMAAMARTPRACPLPTAS
jgi:hydrogenase maturation protease